LSIGTKTLGQYEKNSSLGGNRGKKAGKRLRRKSPRKETNLKGLNGRDRWNGGKRP